MRGPREDVRVEGRAEAARGVGLVAERKRPAPEARRCGPPTPLAEPRPATLPTLGVPRRALPASAGPPSPATFPT